MKSFQDILMEKMEIQPIPSTPTPGDLDPAGLAFLMGEVRRYQFKAQSKYRIQPNVLKDHPPTPKASLRREFDSAQKPAVKIRKPGPAHKLNETQKKSFQFFSKTKFPLEADFSVDELKYCFRKLALLFHPDRGGHDEIFISLKAHYEILKKISNHA